MPNLRDLVVRNRSYRRFDESHRISHPELVELVELARCTASATAMPKYSCSAQLTTTSAVASQLS